MGRLAALALVIGCAAPPAPDPWTLWTIDTLKAAGDPAVVPAGGDLALLQAPYPVSGNGKQVTANAGLTVFPAFAEGSPAAYMTTEVWQNFDEVWVQPVYVGLPLGSAKLVFSVDTASRFYSPYWQIFYYQTPAGVQFTSEKQVLESGLQLSPGPGAYWSITEDASIVTALQQGDAAPRRPLTGETVGKANNFIGYVNDKVIWFIDLGPQQRFTWNYETQVVEETPLYSFAMQDRNLNPVPLSLPNVGGSGPPHHARCDGQGHCTGFSGAPGSAPEFGSLWRLYTVLLPPGADAYVPPGNSALAAQVRAMGLPATPPSTTLDPAFILRVALNGTTCFGAAQPLSACRWLDSQTAIEANLPDWRVTKTGTLVTCPLLSFAGKILPVPAP